MRQSTAPRGGAMFIVRDPSIMRSPIGAECDWIIGVHVRLERFYISPLRGASILILSFAISIAPLAGREPTAEIMGEPIWTECMEID
jgi:hypothetical protein